MDYSLQHLPWLPKAPADFSARCRALATAEGPLGPAIQALATFQSSSVQAGSLSRAIAKALKAERDLMPLSPLRLGVLTNTTFDLLYDEFAPAAARHGVALSLVTAPFDQVVQEALDPASQINAARLDAVLVAVDQRWLRIDQPLLGGNAAARIGEAVAQLENVLDGLQDHGGAVAILQTVPTPAASLFGSFDRRVPGAVRRLVEDFNRELIALAERRGAYVIDAAALKERVGADNWFDPVQWLANKLPFAPRWNAAYADMLGRLLGAVRGKARKCLVLDLDNTTWGGVIGDDGLEGIKVGQGSPVGEAFLAIQQAALDLHSRGVILAVCSKNDEQNARLPFREHRDMLLRESHITVFQANWSDKASNLEAIAKALNIGVDALVLLDDNPAERAQVRAALPMVGVPELPDDPIWFPWMLNSAGYFESVSFSEEDRLRAASYAAEAARVDVQTASRDLGDYLSSLGMSLTLAPFDAEGRQRIAQLINKSNQFNLTTRRYTEAQVAAAEQDPDVFTLQARLADRFSDLGMIGVVIARPAQVRQGPAWELDTWLMSCRVLGRRVEEGVLDAVVSAARSRGVRWLLGVYAPTAKNGMVASHYDKLGFTLLDEDAAGRRLLLDVDAYASPSLPFLQSASSPVQQASYA